MVLAVEAKAVSGPQSEFGCSVAAAALVVCCRCSSMSATLNPILARIQKEDASFTQVQGAPGSARPRHSNNDSNNNDNNKWEPSALQAVGSGGAMTPQPRALL